MVIKDYIAELPKKKKGAFYKFVLKHLGVSYHTIYYKFIRDGGHATVLDEVAFENIIEKFESEYDEYDEYDYCDD